MLPEWQGLDDQVTKVRQDLLKKQSEPQEEL
jgi:hypothetical protein